MRIKCTTTFLDGADRFEKDDIRNVEDERGEYFVKNKWAVHEGGEPDAAAPDGEIDLDIHNGQLGTGDSNG